MKLAAATTKRPPEEPQRPRHLLTGGYYAKYEQAGMEHSSVSVAISDSTRREFEQWYSPPEDWYCETVLTGWITRCSVR